MSVSIPPALHQLWDIAGGDPNDPASDWNSTLDPIGLILLAPPRNFGYWCTPTNSLTFAQTGGDGVHFGLVSTDCTFTDSSPVVMTVPMCDTPNTIVGANLKEFLALGCRFGYFALEQLIYAREATILELASTEYLPEQSEQERGLLHGLASNFKLVPWANPAQRLNDLATIYGPILRLPPEREGAV